jgi:hypothetical protein
MKLVDHDDGEDAGDPQQSQRDALPHESAAIETHE